MKFLYKIYSRYDGFLPRRIPERTDERGRLILGWRHYIDVLEPGAEVWVFFHGHSSYRRGVYATGFVHEVDAEEARVSLKLREWSTDEPLVQEDKNELVADAVSQRGRQVFFLPEEFRRAPECSRRSCARRACEDCPWWGGLPLIPHPAHRRPPRLPRKVKGFVPAYWVIPPRSFVYRLDGRIKRRIREASNLFYSFKTGEEAFAYPLALGVYQSLRQMGCLDFDTIVPVPLSPEKEANGELHRTRVLARELGRLLGISVTEALSLKAPVSKRRLRNAGWSAAAFEEHYLALLEVSPEVGRHARVLVLDDVCDRGSTLGSSSRRLGDAHPHLEFTAATAGRMVVRAAVRDESALLE